MAERQAMQEEKPTPAAVRAAIREHMLTLLREDEDFCAQVADVVIGHLKREVAFARRDEIRPEALRHPGGGVVEHGG
jgi:hypothetical protein